MYDTKVVTLSNEFLVFVGVSKFKIHYYVYFYKIKTENIEHNCQVLSPKFYVHCLFYCPTNQQGRYNHHSHF